MSGRRPWDGSQELRAALQALASAKGISQTRVAAVAKLALQHAKSYKHVVHDVEVFLWKAEPEHRLAGLYAIDAIIRQGSGRSEVKEQYAKRFGIRLADTITAVRGAPADVQPKVRSVLEEWQRRGVYSTSIIEAAGGREFCLRGSPEQERQSPTRSGATTTADPGKLASLLSIIKKKKGQDLPHEDSSSLRSDVSQDRRSPRSRHQDRAEGDRPTSRSSQGIMGEAPRGGIMGDAPRGGIMGDAPRGGIMGDAPRGGIMGDAPPGGARAPPPRQQSRRDHEEWSEEPVRAAKKQRGSRWGPPKPATESSADSRPPPIVTSAPLSSGYEGDMYRQTQSNGGPSSSHNIGSGADAYGRNDGSTTQQLPYHRASSLQQNASEGQINYGYSKPDSNWSAANVSGNPGAPSPSFADRMSPQQVQQPNQPPHSSGEICRKFVAGRCTFGDRCWHVHDPKIPHQQPPSPVPPQMAMNGEMKVKTVLCNNFPLGKCRYGDKCSFAHGVEDLGSARPLVPPHGGWTTQPGSQAMPGGLPQHPPRPFGAGGVPPQAVFNEPQDVRGSTPLSNAGMPGPGARPFGQPSPLPPRGPPAPQFGGTVPPMPPGFAQPPLPGAQSTSRVPLSKPVAPSEPADDDEGEAPVEEFTLQYDDED